MVPADWQHPKDEKGDYIPLFGRSYAEAGKEWDEEWAMWQKGFRRSWADGTVWSPIEDAYKHMRYTDWTGARPSPDDYMPDWPADRRTHLMMYEDTSEGTPISPAFATPEELARWLVDNKASGFGSSTGSYEGWLRVARGGWAPSMVVSNGVISTGVDSLS